MELKLSDKFKEKAALLQKYFLIISVAYFSVVLLCYFIILYKINLQKNQITYIQGDLSAYSSKEQENYENKFSEYKKKIADFSFLVSSHNVSSNIFLLLEEKTLSDVWFNNFNFLSGSAEINLYGKATNKESFSKQIGILEKSSYIKNVDVLDSRSSEDGSIQFTLKISLDPKILSYDPGFIVMNE